jgi:hypothetical protein
LRSEIIVRIYNAGNKNKTNNSAYDDTSRLGQLLAGGDDKLFKRKQNTP